MDNLQNRPDVEPGRLGGLGLSVGGEVMLEAAAEDPKFAAVVTKAASTPSATIWSLPGVEHLKGLQTYPEGYERRVVGFFDRGLRTAGCPDPTHRWSGRWRY